MSLAVQKSTAVEAKEAFEIPDGHVLIERPINYVSGYCYSVEAEACCPASPGDATDSRLFIFENGKPLGPHNAAFALIKRDGKGQFTYGTDKLLFSTSDNTDPNTNGRCYTYARSDELFFLDRFNYSMRQVKWLLRVLELNAEDMQGKRILEIGPGRDLGIALIMAGLGAHTTGIDKYRTGWLANWHEPFIKTICRTAPEHFPTFDPTILEKCIRAHDYECEAITQLPLAIEDFDPTTCQPFDATFSLAALEHVCDAEKVTNIMYQATAIGGTGLHAIDFRDHRDFARPLEFYLIEDAEFKKLALKQHETYLFGNRVPPSHYAKYFEKAGFSNVFYKLNGPEVDATYLKDFLTRLQQSNSNYKNVSVEDFKMISAYYILKK